MLINHLSRDEMTAIKLAVASDNGGAILGVLNEAIWRRLAVVWDEVIWSFWIFKKIKVRDLHFIWVKFFGPPPVDLAL
jgi:hypothetical protein